MTLQERFVEYVEGRPDMARAANQKLKILYILKLLEHSDETHVVTMREILAELAARDSGEGP